MVIRGQSSNMANKQLFHAGTFLFIIEFEQFFTIRGMRVACLSFLIYSQDKVSHKGKKERLDINS